MSNRRIVFEFLAYVDHSIFLHAGMGDSRDVGAKLNQLNEVGKVHMKAQPTILGLMGFIAFFAVAMAAVRTNDESWAAVIFALTGLTLCTASLVAIYRRGAWAGFAVFGWATFLICQPHSAPAIGPTTLPMAMAYRVIFYASDPVKFPWVSFQIPGYPAIMADGEGKPILGAVTGVSAGFLGMVPVNSLRAGLCLSSIVIGFIGAFVGGFIARRCVARGDSRDDASPRLSMPA